MTIALEIVSALANKQRKSMNSSDMRVTTHSHVPRLLIDISLTSSFYVRREFRPHEMLVAGAVMASAPH